MPKPEPRPLRTLPERAFHARARLVAVLMCGRGRPAPAGCAGDADWVPASAWAAPPYDITDSVCAGGPGV